MGGTSFTAFQRRAYPMMSHGSNITQAQYLALEPGRAQGPSPEVFSTRTDEMSIQHLTQMNYAQTVSIPVTATSNTVIFSGRITPTPDLLTLELGESADVNILQYTSSKFSFWQGGLVYR